MDFSPHCRMKSGNLCFRGLVTVAMDSPEEIETLEEGETQSLTHYVRTYLVTAANLGDAAQLLDEFIQKYVPEIGNDLPGTVLRIELSVLSLETLDPDIVEPDVIEGPGVHFVSLPMLFNPDEYVEEVAELPESLAREVVLHQEDDEDDAELEDDEGDEYYEYDEDDPAVWIALTKKGQKDSDGD